MSTVAILICTYKRPELLSMLLHSLETGVSLQDFQCFVIDNDAERSAETVASSSPIVSAYLCEPRPGISHARNAAVRSAIDYDYLLFIDDDEVASPTWVDELVSTAERHQASIVAGPVLSELSDESPKWIVTSGLFDRERVPTGSARTEAGGGNLLIAGSIFRERDESKWFALELGLTGGEDLEFTRRLAAEGHRIVWCDEAVATETVAADRTSFRWLARRYMRMAGTEYGLQSRSQLQALATVFAGLGRVGLALPMLGVTLVAKGSISKKWFKVLFRGAGFIAASFGKTISEYNR